MENTFLKNISCDIYVGKKVGIDLRNTMRKAKKSIIIIAPFLSGRMISEEIFQLLNKDITISIISKENERIYPFLKKNLYQKHSILGFEKGLIIFAKIILIIFYITLAIAILEIFTSFIFNISFMKNITSLSKNNLLIVTFFFAIIVFFFRKLLSIKEFYYSVRDNLKLHILDKNYNLHSKIYIIDNKTAYFGSLNCTDTGFLLNHETCIKTKDKAVIKHFNNIYKDLLKMKKVL